MLLCPSLKSEEQQVELVGRSQYCYAVAWTEKTGFALNFVVFVDVAGVVDVVVVSTAVLILIIALQKKLDLLMKFP